MIVSNDLTDVTLVSDDTYWRLDWCYSSNEDTDEDGEDDGGDEEDLTDITLAIEDLTDVKVKEVEIAKEVIRSDGWWHFACGDV